MPYDRRSDLPDAVRNALPEHAQDIYKEAFNHAWERYDGDGSDSREARAHKIAWSAVEQSYTKNDAGDWVAKDG